MIKCITGMNCSVNTGRFRSDGLYPRKVAEAYLGLHTQPLAPEDGAKLKKLEQYAPYERDERDVTIH